MVSTLAQREPKSQLNSLAEMLRRTVFFMSIAFCKNGKIRICMTNTLVRGFVPLIPNKTDRQNNFGSR